MVHNFNKTVEGDLLIVLLQHLEDTFSVVPTNLRSLGLVHKLWGSDMHKGGTAVSIFVLRKCIKRRDLNEICTLLACYAA